MANDRIYVVTHGDEQRMVEASTPAQAIRHVTRGAFTAKPAGARDVAYLMGRGVVVEKSEPVAEPASAPLLPPANEPPAQAAAEPDTNAPDAPNAPASDAAPVAGDPPAETPAMAAQPGAEGAALAARLTGGKSRKAR